MVALIEKIPINGKKFHKSKGRGNDQRKYCTYVPFFDHNLSPINTIRKETIRFDKKS